MQLSRTDLAILEILLRYRSHPVVESMVDSVFEGGRHYRRLTKIFNVRGPALPCFLGISGRTFLARFESDAPLVKSGLVSVDGGRRCLGHRPTAPTGDGSRGRQARRA